MTRPDPKKLLDASAAVEAANKADEAAKAALVEAAAKGTDADVQLKQLGIPTGDDGGKQPPPTMVISTPANSNSNSNHVAVALIALFVLILLLLVGVGYMLNTKANTGDTQAVAKTAMDARAESVAAGAKADQALTVAKGADAKADKAQQTSQEALALADNSKCLPCAKKATPQAHRPLVKKPAVAKPVAKPVCKENCVPKEVLNIEREQPRTDGKCVTSLSTGHRIQIGKDGTSSRLVARLVDGNIKQVAGSPVVYVGSDAVSGSCHTDEKKLVANWDHVRTSLGLPLYCKPQI